MKKIVLQFGLVSGTISSLLMSASMFWNYSKDGCDDNSMYIGFASMLLAFSLIFVAVKKYRTKEGGGIVSFGRAFLIGLYISIITSTMYVATWGIIYKTQMPDFMDKYVARSTEQIKASGKSDKIKAAKIAELETMKEDYKNPVYFCMYTYMEILPVGILMSLISAAVLMKRKK